MIPPRRVALLGLIAVLATGGCVSLMNSGTLRALAHVGYKGQTVYVPQRTSVADGSSKCDGVGGCPIKHVVFLIKENHSFDNLFGRFPGADGATYATEGNQRVKLGLTPDSLMLDIDHQRMAVITATNQGLMNDFYKLNGAIQFGHDYADSNFDEAEIPNYWSYASHFALADHFFSTIMGPSFPNHLATIAAQSGGAVDNPYGQTNHSWGCDAAGRRRYR